jgi:hypothetical protein
MSANGKFNPGRSGNPRTRFQPGNRHRWQPGQSGNPDGIARRRLEFEKMFYEALLGQGAAEEAASLLWDAARDREPWAIQALLQRLAPETKQINLTHGLQDEELDYGQLTDEELATLERIAERAKVQTGFSESGASASQPEGIPNSGMACPGTEH